MKRIFCLTICCMMIYTQAFGLVVGYSRTVASGGSYTVSYGGTENASSVITGTTLTLTVPSGVSTGDKMYASLSSDAGDDWAIHADWTLLARVTAGTTHQLAVAYRVATSADESDTKTYDFTVPSSTEIIGSIMYCTKSGGSWTTPSTYNTDTAQADNLTTDPGLNTTDGSLLLSFWGNDDVTETTADPSDEGMTEFITLASQDPKLIGFYQAYVTGASSVTKSTTWVNPSDITSILVLVEAE